MNVKKLATASVLGVAVFLTAACGSDTPAASPGSSDAATSQMTSGDMTSGEMSSGEMTSGEMTSGDMSSGDMSSGEMSSGEMTSGEMSSGEMSSGDMSSGEMTSGEMSSGASDPAANLVGAGCADYAKANPSGAGSVGGMAEAKVAEAASANPLLKTLVAAVSGKVNPDVNLVDTLDGGEFTVFAPVDTAFEKVDAATMGKLKTDKDLLQSILTYHVIAGQIAPDKIVGTHKTVQGGDVTVTGSGDNLKVGDATVICGGVKTANATVYLIDSVLSPPAS